MLETMANSLLGEASQESCCFASRACIAVPRQITLSPMSKGFVCATISHTAPKSSLMHSVLGYPSHLHRGITGAAVPFDVVR